MKLKIGNFLSISDKQELSMLSNGNNDDNRTIHGCAVPVLRTTLVYGPNAAGKSSLIRALIYSRGRIVGMDPLKSKLSADFKNRLNSDFSHRTKDGTVRDDVSYFEYMIEIGGHVYSYGFETMTRESIITSEWLVEYWSDGTKKTIIDRDQVGMILHDGIEDSLARAIDAFNLKSDKNSELFLRFIGREYGSDGVKEIFDVYRWFRNELIIRTSDSILSGFLVANEEKDAEKPPRSKVLDDLSKKMKDYDTGIAEFAVSEMRDVPTGIVKNLLVKSNFNYDIIREGELFLGIVGDDDDGRLVLIKREGEKISFFDVFMVHENGRFRQLYKDESDGTKRILQMLLMTSADARIYSTTSDYSKTRTVIIDEIDRSIHPNMTVKMVKDFIDDGNLSGYQLIATAHESHIIPMLRTDEVWFIGKDGEKGSLLYPLEKYVKNYKGDVGRLYLEGRFGAIPNLKPVDTERSM